MRKKRIIPTLPVDFFKNPTDKNKYQKILYKSIIEGVEQSLSSNKKKFVMARVDDGKNITDVEILEESFKSNLETVLSFYEQQEEYELCSKTLELLNQIK
jgi:ferric iron reductase protein FhuF